MALPVNIEQLINGNIVEWDRLEFKEGWNPEEIVHSICAFANDINNWGGGYIVIGINTNKGVPNLPPVGLHPNQIDAIQKKLIEFCYLIEPFYSPITSPAIFQEKNIFIIWVPGGDNRPYKAPSTLGQKGQKRFFIRKGSSSVIANSTEERFLIELAAKIPFDDRINHHAALSDLSLPIIQSFLKEIGSDLYKESAKIPFNELCRQMKIVSGPPEYLKPLNVGLLLFSDNPEKHFRGAIIEVVIYKDSTGKNFLEKKFLGPLHVQLRNALSYIKNNVLHEEVKKISGRAEALRFFNYPFEAIEEALANAVYHRSYEHESTIEVNIHLDRIEILSFPGPLPPIDNDTLKLRRIVARDYRNRRIGDFLKELHLTEGRSTGFPTIYDSLEKNGSPVPNFQTDADRTYFLSTFYIHPVLKEKTESELLSKQPASTQQVPSKYPASIEQVKEVLIFCSVPRSRKEIQEKLNLKDREHFRSKILSPLLESDLLKMLIPSAPNSPKQKYVITDKALRIIEEFSPNTTNA